MTSLKCAWPAAVLQPLTRALSDLSNNDLTGTIPQEGGVVTLTSLSLANNRLVGAVPDWIGKNTGLVSLCAPPRALQNSLVSHAPLQRLVEQRIERNNPAGVRQPCRSQRTVCLSRAPSDAVS